MAYRRRLKNKKPPEGWELIEEVIEDFEGQMKEAVNEEHEGRRKNELAWKIHRIHWEKNRFIFDLMYQRKVMSKELVSPHPCSVYMQLLPLSALHSFCQYRLNSAEVHATCKVPLTALPVRLCFVRSDVPL